MDQSQKESLYSLIDVKIDEFQKENSQYQKECSENKRSPQKEMNFDIAINNLEKIREEISLS
jgi:sugar-specific transcriptional regulator TrmB